MSGHYIVKCKDCRDVISQCRCPSRDKQVTFIICSSCQKKREEEAA